MIWHNCEHDINGNVIFTFHTLNEYVECMKVPLSVRDKKMILKIKHWAANAIADMQEE